VCTRRQLAFGPHVRAVLGDEFQLWGGIDFFDGMQARDVLRTAPEDPNASPHGTICPLAFEFGGAQTGPTRAAGLDYRSPTDFDLSTPSTVAGPYTAICRPAGVALNRACPPSPAILSAPIADVSNTVTFKPARSHDASATRLTRTNGTVFSPARSLVWLRVDSVRGFGDEPFLLCCSQRGARRANRSRSIGRRFPARV
jgi:hypothetical protein